MKAIAANYEKWLAIIVLAATAIWVLVAFSTWRDFADGLRFTTPWRPTFDAGPRLFDSAVGLLPLIAVLALNAGAMIIGYSLIVRPLWGHRRLAAPIWLLFSGAIPGTLIIIAISRISTLFLPNALAPGVIGILILAAVGVSFWKCSSQTSDDLAHWKDGVWLAMAAFLTMLVIGVAVDQNHVVGEGSLWFIKSIFLSHQYGIGTDGRWPIISQHYDEAAFLYPIVYGIQGGNAGTAGTMIFYYWVTLAVGRIGIATLTYVAVRGLGLDRLSTLALVTFFWAASLSINPASSALLFDSLSPLGSALHMARLLIPVAPLIIVSAAQNIPWRIGWPTLVIAVLLGIGVSSLPIHAVIVLMWAVGVMLLSGLAPEAGQSPRIWQAACGVALITLLAFTAAYGLQGFSAPVRAGVLIGASVLGVLILAWVVLRDKLISPDWNWLAKISAIIIMACGGYAIGVLLLGNIFIGKTFSHLSNFWPWADIPLLERAQSTLAKSTWSFTQSPYCDGYYWNYRLLAAHCADLPRFIRTYGLPFVVIPLVIAWWALSIKSHKLISVRCLTMLFWGINLSLLALPLSFVVYDFISPAETDMNGGKELSIWLRSRLSEPWFYGGTMLALVLLLRESSKSQRRAAQSLMFAAVAIFGMNIAEFPTQYIANLAYVLSRQPSD